MMDSLLPMLPYLATYGAVIATGAIIALFVMFRSDAIREGKAQPTKLAVQLTLSAVKNALLLRKAAKGEVVIPRPRTSKELEGTISGGAEIRADDIAAIIAQRQHSKETP